MLANTEEANSESNKSFRSITEELQTKLLENDDDEDFLSKHKRSERGQYYTICTINCLNKPNFVNAAEKSPLFIEDADSTDYWIVEDKTRPTEMILVPRCCISVSADELLCTATYGKKRNPREAFREDILQISNKNQESSMKRKYVVADMIECDREYGASLKVIRGILSSLDMSGNKFRNEILNPISDVQETIAQLTDIHERQILPKLSTCTLNPANVAQVLLEEKENLKVYSKLKMQWKILKSEIEKLSEKHILLKNDSNYDNSKISISAFIEMMKKVDQKLLQYSSFLFGILIYTGRVGGDIYEIQKAITMINRIKRMSFEMGFFKTIIGSDETWMEKERITRMTDQVLVQEAKMVKRSGKIMDLRNSKTYDIYLLKAKIILADKGSDGINKLIFVKDVKVFQCDENEQLILWCKSKNTFQILLFQFQSELCRRAWDYYIKYRLGKQGVKDTAVSSDDYDQQYGAFVVNNQKLVAIEMESVPMESSIIDDSSAQFNSELYEEMTSSIDSSSDINYESALMDTPSSITSTSYNTARDKLKTSTDKATRPLSGISQDSISTLDGIRTPFEEEDLSKVVIVQSDVAAIDIVDNKDLTWSLTLENYDRQSHSIVWSIDGQPLNHKDSNTSVKISELGSRLYQCQLLMKQKPKLLRDGQMTCKVVDILNGSLISSASVELVVPTPFIEIELDSTLTELTVKENQPVEIKLKVTKRSDGNLSVNYFVWCKDNEKVEVDNKRVTCFFDEKEDSFVLFITKANRSDAGIYTVETGDSKKLLITNSGSVSILVLIETVKKTVYRTASQEDPRLFDETDLTSISPIKGGENITGFSNELVECDTHNTVITTTKMQDIIDPILKVRSTKVEVDEFGEVTLEVGILGKLKDAPKWYFGKKCLTANDDFLLAYEADKNIGKLTIRRCERNYEGWYKCTAVSVDNKVEDSVNIEVKVRSKEVQCSLECEVQEIDLKCGETMKLEMKAVGLAQPVLMGGSWYLNSKILDLKTVNGEFTALDNRLTIQIANVTKDIQGRLQFKITGAIEVSSSEIEIKVREAEKVPPKTTKSELKLRILKPDLEVLENKEILLEIDIIGGYVAMYQTPKWTLNGVPIINRNCKPTLEAKRCKLSIMSCKLKDAGKYKCTFLPGKGNPSGPVEAEFNVGISDPKKIQSGKKTAEIISPIIKLMTPTTEFDESSEIVIEAELLGTIDGDPKWYFNGNILEKNDNVDTVFKIDQNTTKVIVRRCSKNHEGEYKCIVINPGNGSEESVTVNVKVILKQYTGLLECDIQEIDLKIGEMLLLEMRAVEIEESVLKTGLWFLNKLVLDLEKVKGEFSISNSRLVLKIPEVARSIEGSLQFRITKPVEISSSEIDIKVREADKAKDVISPIISTKSSAIEVDESKELIVEVQIIGKVDGNVKWYFNGSILTKNEKVDLVFVSEKGLAQCVIRKVEKSHEGEYMCLVFNSRSGLEESVTVNVRVVSKQETGLLDCDIQEIDLKAGEILKLEMKASGIDDKVVKLGNWYLNNKLLDLNKIKGEFMVSSGLLTLRIPNVQKSIQGMLQFRLSKPVNVASSEIEIRIREVDKKLNKDDLKLKEIKSHFELVEKEELRLEIEILSGNVKMYEAPKWSLNGKSIVNRNSKITLDGRFCRYVVPLCQSTDSGDYKCSFLPAKTGKVNPAVASFFVNISQIKKSMVVANPSVEATEGDSVTLCVETEGYVEGDLKWIVLENCDRLESKGVSDRVMRKFNNNLSLLLIDNVSREDTGTYVCKGFVNRELKTEALVVLSVQPKQKTQTPCAGNFEKDVYVVKRGEKVTMRAVFNGFINNPQVVWYLNSTIIEIESDVTSRVMEDGRFASELTVQECAKDNAGVYDCIVEQKDQSPTKATTVLKVEGIIERRTIRVFEGERISFELLFEKDQKEIVYEWCKNGTILSTSCGFTENRDNGKVTFWKERSTLTDSGLYTCRSFLNSIVVQEMEFSVTVETETDNNIGEKLSLICDEKEILANESEPLLMSVEVDKWQVASVQWFLNGSLFGDPLELDSQFIDLYIESPKTKVHSGTFRCEVTNKYNMVSYVDIVVRFDDGGKKSIEEDIDLLSCTVEEVDLIEGSELQLSIISKHPTDFREMCHWYKEGCLLDEYDPRLSVIVQPFNYNLILRNVTVTDSGNYSLNVDGQSVQIQVRVRTKPADIQTKSGLRNLVTPKTKLKMTEIKLETEPQVVKFEFEIEECGPTKAVWYFENEQIEIDNSEFIQWSCDNYFALTIPMACQRHCGRYTIKVANEMGYVKDEAELCLVAKSRFQSFMPAAPENIEESCCISPLFTKKLKSIDLLSGDILRLSCRLMSEPEPRILWTKDGETLDPKNSNRKMKVLNNFPNYELTIAEMSMKDVGQYCCMASNFLGYDTTCAVVTIDGWDFDNGESPYSAPQKSRFISKPINVPILNIVPTNTSGILLTWTEVLTTDASKVTYSIEKQKFNKSNNWKLIRKDIVAANCPITAEELPLNQAHHLRCVATTDFGYQVVSNIVSIDAKMVPPTMPVVKPTVTFFDASCAVISWQRGKCHGLTSEESFGKLFYCLELKDNPKGDWQTVDNRILKNEYCISMEPDISYMFRVSAVNDNGVSEPSPCLVTRIDRMKLVPDFSLDVPWIHVQGQPCLKWRAAYVPEFCDKCVPGIAPEYKVEFRSGRLAPWQLYQDHVTQSQVFLNQDVLSRAQELRVSCENRFGQIGPTKGLKIPEKISAKVEKEPGSGVKIQNVTDIGTGKKAAIDCISTSGLGLKWEAWAAQPNHRYLIQKKSAYSSDWSTIEPNVYGEDYFLNLKLSENHSREVRILAIEEEGRVLWDGYNPLTIPTKEDLVPSVPVDIKVSKKLSSHVLSWTPSKNHDHVDLPITYSVQFKNSTNYWITAANIINSCTFTNDKIGDFPVIFYRICASNAFGSSGFSSEIQVNTPLNALVNEQIIKSIRYFVIDFERLDIKWQMSDVVFDNGLNIDDMTFVVERKSAMELTDWAAVGNCIGKCSGLVGFKFGDENIYRVQPYVDGEKMSPSRMIRISLTKELLVPDMSFIRPEIFSDSITEYSIEWTEPNIEGGFSPEGLNLCSISVLTTDLRYQVEYRTEISTDLPRSLAKFSTTGSWIIIDDDVIENSINWTNPDPTKEYSFRVTPFNQFGDGQPSRIVKLRSQIVIPDFSFIRPNIDDLCLGSKSLGSDIILSWVPPKINPERYTPYTVDVQYRPKGVRSSDEWSTLKSGIKKSRVSINELDPTIDYEVRIVPVTEFGSGNPSVIVKRPKCCVQERSTNDQASDTYLSSQTGVTEVFVSLTHDVELQFNVPAAVNKDHILWHRNDQLIEPKDDRMKFYSTEKDRIFLLISNVKEEDIGIYNMYTINNDLLQTIKLTKADAPTIINAPRNLSVNLHDNVLITFKIDSQPPATVLWCKNWQKIYSSHRTMIIDDQETGRYSLKLSKCILSDNGEYSLRAENAVGFVELKFHLRVDDQPETKMVQINEGDISDRFYVVKQISRGTYSTCQLMAEKSSRREFVGKLFGRNNIEIGKMEFESIKNVRHRNFVELFDVVLNSGDYLILIYESFEAAMFVDYISTLAHWDEHLVQLITHQLFQAISYLHRLGICHLDIQPSNIMITGKLADTVKICDYSNATIEEHLENRRPEFTLSPFSSPELLKGESISLKTDVWSLGVLCLICLKGRLSMDLEQGLLDLDEGRGLLSDAACDFIARCVDIDIEPRLSSSEALTHEWFTGPIPDYIASLDHLKDDIVKLMTFPEEMVLNFSPDMQSAIKNSLVIPKPKLVVDSVQSSPSISQISSRASSVSRDGINYERCDITTEPIPIDSSSSIGESKETLQLNDETYVPNSARELVFTVPLKDQTFRPAVASGSGNIVNLTCQLALSASDAISISWYRNQELLTDGTKIRLEVLDGGFLSCTIVNPWDADTGIYRCIARSRSLRAETCARLLVGDIPDQPGKPTVLFTDQNGVLLKWTATLSATDDIMYRVDCKEIGASEDQLNWKTLGYTVDNRYLTEDFPECPCITRVVAQNKYGFSPYSVASSAFQYKSSYIRLLGKQSIPNKQWMTLTRQSKDSNNLHDLTKDIPSNEISGDFIYQNYRNQSTIDKDVKVLALKQLQGSFPDFIVQRRLDSIDKHPAIDLCLRMKYYHLPMVYGIIDEPSSGIQYSIEEYVPGGDLISVLLARESYSEFTVVTILRQLIETVQFLHSNNIIHTNINPSNILVARRTNQLYDIKLIGLHHCQSLGVAPSPGSLPHKVEHKMSTFQAPEFRYEGITKNETDIWSIGTLAFLLLATQLPIMEDICSDSDVQCPTKNCNTLHLPTMHTHFRSPELSLLTRFTKNARKFVYNSLKKNPNERGDADYWLANPWFCQDLAAIDEMQMIPIRADPLLEYMTNSA